MEAGENMEFTTESRDFDSKYKKLILACKRKYSKNKIQNLMYVYVCTIKFNVDGWIDSVI